MKNLFIAVFDKLLTDPANKRICNWGLAISFVLYFGNIVINLLIKNV